MRLDLDDLRAVCAMLDPVDPVFRWAWVVATWGDRYFCDMIGQLDDLADLLADPAANRAAIPADHRLDGARLSLVPVLPQHHEPLRAIHAEPAVSSVWGEPDRHWPDDPGVHGYAIELGAQGAVVGFIQWGEERDPQYRHAGIDVFVTTVRHGQGIGTAAVTLLAAHLVHDLGFHRLVIDPAADNAAADRVLPQGRVPFGRGDAPL